MPLIKLFLLPVILLFGLGSPSDVSKKTLSTQQSFAKQEFFKYMRCHRQAKNIVINWGVSSTVGINRFVIYHSDDGGEFYNPLPDPVFPDGDTKYSFKDESVFPGIHYYYVAAIMNSGPPVISPIDIVRIVGH